MLALRLVIGDRRARLHRIDDNAVGAEPQFCDMRRARKRGIDLFRIAEMEIEPDIARHVVVKDRRIGSVGLGRFGDRRQRIDVDRYRFGGVLGLRLRLGDDRGDRFADMPDLIRRQHIMRRRQHRLAVAAVHDLARRQRPDPALRQILGGIDREHPRHRARRRGVDAADDAVRHMAAHHHRIGLAGEVDVVGVMALAAQQHRVFGARHRLPDREFLLRPEQGRIDVIIHR